MTEYMSKIYTAFNELDVAQEIRCAATENIQSWLTERVYGPYVPYIEHLIDNQKWDVLLDSFWRMMPFGTGGRRGPIGAGPNRINPYTISLSVQGHCEYLKNELKTTGDISVVVAHDVRRFHDMRGLYTGVEGVLSDISSLDLAKISAMTYAANGIKVYVVGPLEDGEFGPKCTNRYISTPELSFMIRKYGAIGGLNISASHNHPDDNGGKFYNRHGGQEIPPDDEKLLNVVENVTEVRTVDYGKAVKDGMIAFVSKEVHDEYIRLNSSLIQTASRSAKVGYTPLCGTGMTTVYEAFKKLNFDVVPVPEQSVYDGSFKSVRYRIGNPEVPDALDRLEHTAETTGCDVGFASDPDADRLGMIAKMADGRWHFVNGHEIGVLLLQSIISSKKKKGTLSEKGIFVNTLVTTSLQRVIAKANGLQVAGDLMVGCKYIADVVRCLDENGQYPAVPLNEKDSVAGSPEDYVFGTEESHGYLVSPEIRDKDACGAAIHLAGLISDLKDNGQTLEWYLRDIYKVYGYYRNVQRSLVMEGIVGLNRIRQIQDVLRKNPPATIAKLPVLRFVDNHVVGGPLLSSTDASSRNVLLFELDGGEGVVIRLVVRPSGTEPKTKIYVEVPSTWKMGGTLDSHSREALDGVSDEVLDEIIDATNHRATLIGNEFIRYCLGAEVLGDAYQEVPDESLLVSDLVTVDNKIALCTDILPTLRNRIRDGQELVNWWNNRLRSFGEDANGLIHHAAKAWINRAENGMSEDERKIALALFI
ncbi:MAG: phospho-sugar mutase [Deltaproteobacteria bacterium]|nr:phospho-sugar mutase [Deltaproteobacteria bacterium]